MQSLRRTAINTARKGRTTLPRQPRRYAHEEHGHEHGHAAANESFGSGFWVTVGAIPAGWALYSISRSSPENPSFIARLIDKYTERQEALSAVQDVHVRLLEQAGSDRVLFHNERPQEYVDMKFPEIMSMGSPYNVPAGSQVSMSKVVEKYKKEANEENERKLEQLRNGTLPAEQPVPQLRGPRYEKTSIPTS